MDSTNEFNIKSTVNDNADCIVALQISNRPFSKIKPQHFVCMTLYVRYILSKLSDLWSIKSMGVDTVKRLHARMKINTYQKNLEAIIQQVRTHLIFF